MEIDKFKGQYDFLSNFYVHPFMFNGIIYQSVEHAYQAYKATTLADHDKVAHCDTPAQAKGMGKSITKYELFDLNKITLMRNLVYEKFAQSSELRKALFNTGRDELIEGNYWNDRFWGVCNGEGINHLGKILMWVRYTLKLTEPKDNVRDINWRI